MTDKSPLLAAILVAMSAALEQQIRDTRARAQDQTAAVSGVVVSRDVPPRELRRAVVTVQGVMGRRSAITDDSGRFSIDALPEGPVAITAVKSGFVSAMYGATAPGRQGTPVQLARGQVAEVRIEMTRGAVLSGTIRDSRGVPMSGLRVWAINTRGTQAGPLRPWESVRTDDRGEYNLFDLPAGEYVIASVSLPRDNAAPSVGIGRYSIDEIDAILARLQARQSVTDVATLPRERANAMTSPDAAPVSLAPIYLPGTPIQSEASRISVKPGEEITGLDFIMTAVPVMEIVGVVVRNGSLTLPVEVSITPVGHLFSGSALAPKLVSPPGVHGDFRFSHAAPGRYLLMARHRPPPGEAARAEFAVEYVEVAPASQAFVTLALQPGATLTGRVSFDGTVQSVPKNLNGVRVTVAPIGSGALGKAGDTLYGNHFSRLTTVPVGADGTFVVAEVAPGRYRIECEAPVLGGPTWRLRSAVIDGRDVLDDSLEIRLGEKNPIAHLTMTDRHTELVGSLSSAVGVPAPQYTVIVFPFDQRLWNASRRVRSARPGTDGQFVIKDLPAGEYLVAALTDVEPDEWWRPEFLAPIAPNGIRITLVEGEKKTMEFRIAGGGK